MPAKRLEVSRSKKSGEIAELLDELDEAEATGDRKLGWLLRWPRAVAAQGRAAHAAEVEVQLGTSRSSLTPPAILSFGVASATERASSLL